jgi:ZIP family zinc transporter
MAVISMVDVLYSAALGFIAGLVPVYLGLLPLPFFRRLSASKRNLLISFSVGILLFLFVDVTGEAVKLSKATGYGSFLFAVGLVMGIGIPFLISSRRRPVGEKSSAAAKGAEGSLTAYIISVAIGLHNLGEGLALGSAYAAGQLALTSILVIGFALHNGTEGVAISGPASDIPIRAREPILMGFLAGFPTVVGSVIGSIFYSDLAGALFFSIAAGALLYVVVELLRRAQSPKSTFAGLLIGILLMYFTDLLLSI